MSERDRQIVLLRTEFAHRRRELLQNMQLEIQRLDIDFLCRLQEIEQYFDELLEVAPGEDDQWESNLLEIVSDEAIVSVTWPFSPITMAQLKLLGDMLNGRHA